MKRFEVLIGLGTLVVSVVLLGALWQYLAVSTLYNKVGVGKGPYNPYATHPDKALPW